MGAMWEKFKENKICRDWENVGRRPLSSPIDAVARRRNSTIDRLVAALLN